MIKLNNTFHWENYNKGKEEYKFEDLTIKELKDWAKKWNFEIKKIKNKIYVISKFGNFKMLYR